MSPLDALVNTASNQLATNARRRQAAGGGADSTAVWNDGNLNIKYVPPPAVEAPVAAAPAAKPVVDTKDSGIMYGGGSGTFNERTGSRSRSGYDSAKDSGVANQETLSTAKEIADFQMSLLSKDERAAIARSAEAAKTGGKNSPADQAMILSAQNKIRAAMQEKGMAGSGSMMSGGKGRSRGCGSMGGAEVDPIKGASFPKSKPGMSFDDLPTLKGSKSSGGSSGKVSNSAASKDVFKGVPPLYASDETRMPPKPKQDTGWRTLPNGKKIKIGDGGGSGPGGGMTHEENLAAAGAATAAQKASGRF